MSKSASELNDLFKRGETALQSHFAEIRTNILLEAGFHHPKFDRFGNNRNSIFRDISRSKKIRVTKNHIQVVTKFIRNSIQNKAPDGAIFPANEKELSDQKSAELNQSVYESLKAKHALTYFYARLIHDFVTPGEAYAKVFWDPEGGEFLGYEQDEEGGDAYPKFKGGLVYERVAPYNYITDPDADSELTNKWGCIRKFFPRKVLEERYMGKPDELEIIKKSGGDKHQWFDGFTGIYSDNNDEVELREWYFKPCKEYPNGWFSFATDYGVLEEGELPDGFCIFSTVFDESPENPRGYSIVKQAKPFQVEINRCAAAIITESLVLGHSTVIYQAGSKLTTSSIGNGLKGLVYSSAVKPDVIPGRNGDQYIEYMESQIAELYKVCMVPNMDEEKVQSGQNDAMAMLMRSLRDKMKFSLYAEKMEKMIMDIIDYSLKLCRRYLMDDEVIPIVGKTEAVNIPEFKSTTPSQYQIRIKPRSDDFSSTMGKSLYISQVLQYSGGQLPPEAIANLVRQIPFLNDEEMLADFTVKQDQADAIILSLDRGEIPFFFERCDHEYMIARLTNRMNRNDFPILDQKVQIHYGERINMHEQVLQKQQQEAANATSGFIPSGGGLVSADYYITTPEGKQQRVRLPYEAVDWLVKKLGSQGSDVEKITNLPLASQAQLGNMMSNNSQQSPGMAQPNMGGQLPLTGS